MGTKMGFALTKHPHLERKAPAPRQHPLALPQFERRLIQEHTRAGLVAAGALGRLSGPDAPGQ